jgi:hypothetical protein
VPFESDAQRRYLYSQKPDVARKFAEHGKMRAQGARDTARLGFSSTKFVDDKKKRYAMYPAGQQPAASEISAMVGKLEDGRSLHTLIFDKKAFPKRLNVIYWFRANKYARSAAIQDKGGEWHVRQGSPEVAGLENARVLCDSGVHAIVGMPRNTSKGMISLSRVARLQKAGGAYWGFPTISPIGGASGPGDHDRRVELPDFRSIYYSPEAQKREKQEAKQSKDRRKSLYRDLSTTGFHGNPSGDDKLRYLSGDASTADMATQRPHFLTEKKIKEHKQRIAAGYLDYDLMLGEKKSTKKSKVGK